MFESLKQNQRFLTFVSFWQKFEPLQRVTLGAVHRQNEVWARSLPLQHLPAQQALAVSQYIAAIVHIRSSVLLVSSLWHFRLHSSAQQIGVCVCAYHLKILLLCCCCCPLCLRAVSREIKKYAQSWIQQLHSLWDCVLSRGKKHKICFYVSKIC